MSTLPVSAPQATPSSLDAYTISTLLWSGLYLYEVVQSVPIDWKIIAGRRGCRWGAVALYFPFRSLAAVTFACAIAGLFPPPWQPNNATDVKYAGESVNMISRAFVYHILVLHVSSLWKSWVLSAPLCAFVIGMWVVITYSISRIRGPWFMVVVPKVLSIYYFCLATVLLALFVIGLIRGRAGSRFAPISNRLSRYAEVPTWYMLWQEKVHLLLPLWMAQAVASISLLAKTPSDTISALEITSYTVIIVCGGRIYQHMTAESTACATDKFPCLVTSAIRAGKVLTKHPRFNDADFGIASCITQASNANDRPADLRENITVVANLQTRDVIELSTLASEDNISPTSHVMLLSHSPPLTGTNSKLKPPQAFTDLDSKPG